MSITDTTLSQHSSSSPIIEKLILTTCIGDQLDITPQLLTFFIFEDMFYPCLTGEIRLLDSIGMLDQLSISGNEKLTIKFYSYDYDSSNTPIDFMHRTFDILKISNIIQKNNYTKEYTLHFASPELKLNELIKISTTYQNSANSDVIVNLMTADYDATDEEPDGLGFPTTPIDPTQPPTSRSKFLTPNDIAANYQKVDEFDSVELFVEKTKYIEPFITLPYAKPWEHIQNFASKSIRHAVGRYGTSEKSTVANFLFFENKRGYQYVSLESLLENKDNVQTLRFSQLAQSLEQQSSDRNIIEKLQILDQQDVIANIHSGMYASRLINYDISTGELYTSDYDYAKEFGNTETMETEDNQYITPYPTVYLDSNGESLVTNKPFSRYVMTPTIIRGIDIMTSGETQRINDTKTLMGVEEYLQKRMSQIGRLNTFKLMLQIPGNSTFKVGDIVSLDLRYLPNNDGDSQPIETQLKYYSGNYIVQAIKHVVEYNSYKMIMEVSKDSFLDKIGSLPTSP